MSCRDVIYKWLEKIEHYYNLLSRYWTHYLKKCISPLKHCIVVKMFSVFTVLRSLRSEKILQIRTNRTEKKQQVNFPVLNCRKYQSCLFPFKNVLSWRYLCSFCMLLIFFYVNKTNHTISLLCLQNVVRLRFEVEQLPLCWYALIIFTVYIWKDRNKF
jgi:hypothetical protein